MIIVTITLLTRSSVNVAQYDMTNITKGGIIISRKLDNTNTIDLKTQYNNNNDRYLSTKNNHEKKYTEKEIMKRIISQFP
jgi:hypothetical protein